MVSIISKGQTADLILITVAIEKEPLKIPRVAENIEVNDLMDDEIKQLIKDGL